MPANAKRRPKYRRSVVIDTLSQTVPSARARSDFGLWTRRAPLLFLCFWAPKRKSAQAPRKLPPLRLRPLCVSHRHRSFHPAHLSSPYGLPCPSTNPKGTRQKAAPSPTPSSWVFAQSSKHVKQTNHPIRTRSVFPMRLLRRLRPDRWIQPSPRYSTFRAFPTDGRRFLRSSPRRVGNRLFPRPGPLLE